MKVYEFKFSQITDFNIGNIDTVNSFLSKRAFALKQYVSVYLLHPGAISLNCPRSLRNHAKAMNNNHYWLGFFFMDKNKTEIYNFTLIVDLGETFPSEQLIKDIAFLNKTSILASHYNFEIQERDLHITVTIEETELLKVLEL